MRLAMLLLLCASIGQAYQPAAAVAGVWPVALSLFRNASCIERSSAGDILRQSYSMAGQRDRKGTVDMIPTIQVETFHAF